MGREYRQIRKTRKEADNGLVYDNGEIGLDFNHFEGGLSNLVRWTKHMPKVNFNLDPVINFKLKQKISHFGACITLGKWVSISNRHLIHCFTIEYAAFPSIILL